MKSSELRIGNFVINDAWGGESKIDSGDLLAMTQCELAGKDAEFIKPITLTDEWLEEHGFKFIDMMFENVAMRYWRNDFMIVEESKVVLLYNDKEIVTTVNVGYVHQLQNLYFILTGREIEIKKKYTETKRFKKLAKECTSFFQSRESSLKEEIERLKINNNELALESQQTTELLQECIDMLHMLEYYNPELDEKIKKLLKQ